MKHRRFLIIIPVILCGMVSTVIAEVITIDVTVKAVDAKERSITVTKTSKTKSKDLELEVGKKAKIVVSGKDAALDSLKPGQRASVSYESDLEVVTKIEATDGDPAIPDGDTSDSKAIKKVGCRVKWTISDTGDSTLIVNTPSETNVSADGSMIRHDDGSVEFQHDFESAEAVDRALLGGAENVEFQKSLNALVLATKSIDGSGGQGRGASFFYSKAIRVPLTLEFDFERTTQPDGLTFALIISNPASNVGFAVLNLASNEKRKGAVELSASWVASRDHKGGPKFDPLIKAQTVELNELKEFNFKIPRIDPEQRYMLKFGVSGEPVVMHHLSVRGRLSPMFGVALDEKDREVFVKSVSPKGLGDTIGIKSGDVCVSVNGKKPNSLKEAMESLGKIQFGDKSEIVVKRGGKTVSIGFTAE